MADVGKLVPLIQSGQLPVIYFDALEIQDVRVQGFGFMDLSDGPDTNPRVTADGKLALDLWFHAGRFPWATPVDTAICEKKTNGFWTPAGTYPMEKHTVVLINPGREPGPCSTRVMEFGTVEGGCTHADA